MSALQILSVSALWHFVRRFIRSRASAASTVIDGCSESKDDAIPTSLKLYYALCSSLVILATWQCVILNSLPFQLVSIAVGWKAESVQNDLKVIQIHVHQLDNACHAWHWYRQPCMPHKPILYHKPSKCDVDTWPSGYLTPLVFNAVHGDPLHPMYAPSLPISVWHCSTWQREIGGAYDTTRRNEPGMDLARKGRTRRGYNWAVVEGVLIWDGASFIFRGASHCE